MKASFTPAVQTSLARARREAERLDPDCLKQVGSAHWLLGLRALPKCAAYQVLRALGYVLEDAAPLWEERALAADFIDPAKSDPYTPPFRQALTLAQENRPPPAHRLCSTVEAGTHHLLAAILRADLTTAIDLATLGITPKAVEDENEKLGLRFVDDCD